MELSDIKKGDAYLMGKRARVITWSSDNFAYGNDRDSILRQLRDQLAASSSYHPDLVCFTEESMLPCGDAGWEESNALALEIFRQGARDLGSNVVCCLEEPSVKYPGRSYNTVYFINRDGDILKKYRKRHITFRAIAKRGLSGRDLAVCDMDIGRVGAMICFDLGWREDWQKLKEMGAQLVVWSSAYQGGFLPNAYAAVHQYWVVTSCWNRAISRIIDPFGQEVAHSSRWECFAMADIDLGAELFHFDHHNDIPRQLRLELGDKVEISIKDGDNIFMLSSKDPQWPLSRIKEHYNLITYQEYQDGSTRDNLAMLEKYPPEAE